MSVVLSVTMRASQKAIRLETHLISAASEYCALELAVIGAHLTMLVSGTA